MKVEKRRVRPTRREFAESRCFILRLFDCVLTQLLIRDDNAGDKGAQLLCVDCLCLCFLQKMRKFIILTKTKSTST
jgi:hypothetical protein